MAGHVEGNARSDGNGGADCFFIGSRKQRRTLMVSKLKITLLSHLKLCSSPALLKGGRHSTRKSTHLRLTTYHVPSWLVLGLITCATNATWSRFKLTMYGSKRQQRAGLCRHHYGRPHQLVQCFEASVSATCRMLKKHTHHAKGTPYMGCSTPALCKPDGEKHKD